jgi:hypothetical protein
MEEFIRRNFLRGFIILIGLYLLIITSLLCKNTTNIKDDIVGREYQNKQLKLENALLKKEHDSLNNIISNQNTVISELYLQDEAYAEDIKRLRSKTLKKEYEKASKFTRNFTSDSIVRYFSNL